MKCSVPWVEKYRPSKLRDVILEPIHRQFFKNIIKYGIFPHLIFYGPPGMGKTSTIINIIREFQQHHSHLDPTYFKNQIMHLNASDERGIDVIRNQIQQFILLKPRENELKFVVLDEVDYMTKKAQQALKHLVQFANSQVRFCLICNYYSKLEESLRTEFICVRFNQLPFSEILEFVQSICQQEHIHLTNDVIQNINSIFYSDIRSVINFIQTNHEYLNQNLTNMFVWFDRVRELLREPSTAAASSEIHSLIQQYNFHVQYFFQKYFNYILEKYPQDINTQLLSLIESLIHNTDSIPPSLMIEYFVSRSRAVAFSP
jgi:replication factor C subunit 3/5